MDQPAAPCRTVDAKTPTVDCAISADVCVGSHWDANNDLYGESCSPDSVNATDHQHRVPPTLTTQASSSTRDDRAERQFGRCQPKHGKAPIGYRSRAFGYTGALYNGPTFVVCTTAQLTDPFGGSSTCTNSIHRLGCQVSIAAERTAARTSSKYEANGGVARSLISHVVPNGPGSMRATIVHLFGMARAQLSMQNGCADRQFGAGSAARCGAANGQRW